MSQTPGTPSADEPQFTVPIPQSDGTRPLPQASPAPAPPAAPAQSSSAPNQQRMPWETGSSESSGQQYRAPQNLPQTPGSGSAAGPTAVQPRVPETAPQPSVSPYGRPAPANSGYGQPSGGYAAPAASTPAYTSTGTSTASHEAASPLRGFGLVLFGMGLGFWALVATRAAWIVAQRGNSSQLLIEAIDSVPEETIVGTSLAVLGALVLLVTRRSGGRSGAGSPVTWLAVLVAAGSVAALVWRLI